MPLAVLFAVLLAPFGRRGSAGRWASVAALVPFVLVIIALQGLTARYGVKLSISYFLGIAIGPLVADLFFRPVPRRSGADAP